MLIDPFINTSQLVCHLREQLRMEKETTSQEQKRALTLLGRLAVLKTTINQGLREPRNEQEKEEVDKDLRRSD